MQGLVLGRAGGVTNSRQNKIKINPKDKRTKLEEIETQTPRINNKTEEKNLE